eukprot:m.181167 g.181167  ORF g.181167 m.181167 type:complete len:457 (+) comp16625_c2_seq3:470-1840(+)
MASTSEFSTVECTVLRVADRRLGMKLTGAGAPFIVSAITADGAAALSGLQVEDRIVKVNNVDVSTDMTLASVVKLISSLQEFILTVRRPTPAPATLVEGLQQEQVQQEQQEQHEQHGDGQPLAAQTSTAPQRSVKDLKEDEDGILSLLDHEPALLEMWDPVAVNYTRKLKLDDSDRVYLMRTLAVDPPIFEIEDFLSEDECESIMNMAAANGLQKSDFTYLDGTNYEERNKDVSNLTPEEADKIFRYSDQTWLSHTASDHLRNMYSRVKKAALLPDRVAQQMEPLQVVKYKEYGHYESHYDSEAEYQGPCCLDPYSRQRGLVTGVQAMHKPLEMRCRICRFMTILYYLVDTEEGGGTVFPLADLTPEQFQAFLDRTDPGKFKQTRTCSPGLVVPPKKAKAVIWYNHHTKDGYLGPRHEKSLHGGCNVIKGHKWIANHWVSEIPPANDPRLPATGYY